MEFPTKNIYNSRIEAEKQLRSQATTFRSAAEEMMNFIPGTSGRLLDVGCGLGWVVAEAAVRGFTATGIDEGKPYIAVGKKHFRVDLRNVSLSKFRTKEKFDVIVLKHVLEHTKDPDIFLARIKILLKPEGVVAIACPNIRSLMYFLFRERWYGLQPEQHLWQFTPKTLTERLNKNGFRVTRVKIGSLAYDTHGWKAMAFKGLVWIGNLTGFGDQVFILASRS